jgi:hypothetical protein
MRLSILMCLIVATVCCALEIADGLGTSGQGSAVCSIRTPYGNHDLEEYLKSVVTCEAWSDEPEALKAVAIAARSYVYYHIALGNDVVGNSQDYQVMTCGKEVPPHIAQAVSDTRGLVLRYQGLYVIGYHSAGHPIFNDNINGQAITCDRMAAYGDNPHIAINSERYVTRNWGLSGSQIAKRENGEYTDHPNSRGGLSQNGARCLAMHGWSTLDILRYYYGMDIEVLSVNSCDFALCADENTAVPMWEMPECKDPSLVQAPAGVGGGAPVPVVPTVPPVQSCDGQYEGLLTPGEYYQLGTVTDGFGLFNGASQTFVETLKAGETHMFSVQVQDKVFWDSPTPFVSVTNETTGTALQLHVKYEDADTGLAISQTCQGQLSDWACTIVDQLYAPQQVSVVGPGANQGGGTMHIQVLPHGNIPADSCIRYSLKVGA